MAKKNKRPVHATVENTPAQKVEFNPDYSQVKKDLSRISLLAGFFFVVLITLSFFLK